MRRGFKPWDGVRIICTKITETENDFMGPVNTTVDG